MPYRFLQAMPSSWKRRYLLRQSGGADLGEIFNLSKKLQKTKRILIAWPESPEEVLIAVPAVKALLQSLGSDAVRTHLAESGQVPLLAGLFPTEPLVAWDRDSLAWHEPAVQTGLLSLRAFNPDVAVSLLSPFPSVLQALIKASGAPLRIALEANTPWPFANVRLDVDSNSALPARYFQVLSLWRYAGIPARERWTRIQSGATQRQAAAEKWSKAGKAPEQTWLFLHEPGSRRAQDPNFQAWLRERIRERDPGEFDLTLVTWNSGNGKAASSRGVSSLGDAPLLEATTPGEFLGILDGARGIAAYNGVGLHFASLAEIQCLALLRRDEAAYDVSPWNPMFRVAWL